MEAELERLIVSLVGDASSLSNDIAQIRNELRSFQQLAEDVASTASSSFSSMVMQMGQALSNVGGQMKSMGRQILGNFMGSIQSGLARAASFEQTEIAFTTFLGSAAETKRTLGDLSTFAAKTPFEMPEILSAARGLITFGDRGEQLMDTLKVLGDVSAGTGARFGDLTTIFNQVRGKGRLQMEEFYQFSERGALSMQDLADHFKVSTAVASDMISKGKVGFDDVLAIFKNLSSEGGRFANMTEKMSTSYSGLISTMNDAIGITMREIGTVFLPIAKQVVSYAIYILEAFRNLPSPVRTALAVFMGLGVVFGGLLIVGGTLLSSLGFILTSLVLIGPAVTAAVGAFMSFAPVAVPLGIVLAAVTALIAAAAGLVAYVIWPEQIASAFGQLGNFINTWGGMMLHNLKVVAITLTELFGLTIGFLGKKFYSFFVYDVPVLVAKGIQKIISLFHMLAMEIYNLMTTGSISEEFSMALTKGMARGLQTNDFGGEFKDILGKGMSDLQFPEFGEKLKEETASAIDQAKTQAADMVDPKLLQEGKQLTQSLRTPLEKLNDDYAKYANLLGVGAIDQETYNRAIKAAQKEYASAEKAARGHREEVDASLRSTNAYAPSLVGLQEDLTKLRMDRGVRTESFANFSMPQPTQAIASNPITEAKEELRPVLERIASVLEGRLPKTPTIEVSPVINEIPNI